MRVYYWPPTIYCDSCTRVLEMDCINIGEKRATVVCRSSMCEKRDIRAIVPATCVELEERQ